LGGSGAPTPVACTGPTRTGCSPPHRTHRPGGATHAPRPRLVERDIAEVVQAGRDLGRAAELGEEGQRLAVAAFGHLGDRPGPALGFQRPSGSAPAAARLRRAAAARRRTSDAPRRGPPGSPSTATSPPSAAGPPRRSRSSRSSPEPGVRCPAPGPGRGANAPDRYLAVRDRLPRPTSGSSGHASDTSEWSRRPPPAAPARSPALSAADAAGPRAQIPSSPSSRLRLRRAPARAAVRPSDGRSLPRR
jgi:hypothetical protein